MPTQRTRLAPSPTGALHLGNARTFLVNWALARQQGWQIVLRVEDLDGPRIKADAAREAIEILQWLGLDWDAGPYYQLENLQRYRTALSQLARQGDIYPCRCSRKEIEAACLSAPHGDEHELRYPGTCRPADPRVFDEVEFKEKGVAWRLRAPHRQVEFADRFCGKQMYDVQRSVGDFLVGTKAGVPSYQLAVVVDDARQGITQVVRGDDLLSSTPRQILLYERLGLEPLPEYTHVPLVVGTDGRRLAKRHGDTRIAHYREAGVAAERIVGLLADWCGMEPRRELTAGQFAELFDLAQMPRNQTVFTQSDDAWLFGGD